MTLRIEFSHGLQEFRSTEWRTPKTNLNNYEGTETVEEGAREAVRVALLGLDGPTGTFSGASGPIPW
jgi:hypothetical protein